MEWARQKGVSDGLCALNMNWGAWTPAAEEEKEEASSVISQPIPGEITNSGFEERDVSSWAVYRHVRANVVKLQAHSGSHSLAESDGEGSVYQDVTGLQPGQRYRISAWGSASPARLPVPTSRCLIPSQRSYLFQDSAPRYKLAIALDFVRSARRNAEDSSLPH